MERALKKSKQRDALLALLRGTKCHPDALWLYQELQKQFPRISLATVYRNLKLLSETGEIIKLDIGDGMEHYDGMAQNHYHFICEQCRRIYDVPFPPVTELELSAAKELDADIKYHSLVFYGTCKSCKE